jgi:hypothetical protein
MSSEEAPQQPQQEHTVLEQLEARTCMRVALHGLA